MMGSFNRLPNASKFRFTGAFKLRPQVSKSYLRTLNAMELSNLLVQMNPGVATSIGLEAISDSDDMDAIDDGEGRVGVMNRVTRRKGADR